MEDLQIKFSNEQLRKLIFPLVVEQFLAITVGLADSIMVASVGEAAVSAVSLVDSVNTLIFYGFAALATGGAVVCGQFLGCRNIKKSLRLGRTADRLYFRFCYRSYSDPVRGKTVYPSRSFRRYRSRRHGLREYLLSDRRSLYPVYCAI